jgi:serine/threonine-protein kinase 24/25/MST4
MDAREIESLSMLSRGFDELKEANPELAYNIILDFLAGINEYVFHTLHPSCTDLNLFSTSNAAVRQHIHTTRGLFPHKRIVRRSELTSKGLVVTEEEEISGMPVPGPSGSGNRLPNSDGVPPSAEAASPARKSPIAELIYMRWLEGLKLKWPSII